MKTVLCFGNEYVKEDALAKELADELKIKGVTFLKCDSFDQVLDYPNNDLFILDVAKGIKKLTVVQDIDKLNTNNIISLHDFDLGYFLKLMKETGKITTITLLALPIGYNKKKAKEEIEEYFASS